MFTEREQVALALAMRYPNQVITESDVEAELKHVKVKPLKALYKIMKDEGRL